MLSLLLTRITLEKTSGWLLITGTGIVALWAIVGPKIMVEHVVRDNEFVAVRLNGSVFVVTPRPATAHFMDFLQKLDDVIKGLDKGTKIIIADDFNSQSAAWGDWETNARGNVLAIFADILNLVIVNGGSNPKLSKLCLPNDVGKLLEILLVRLEAWVENKGGLSPSQFGFRRSLSTIDAAIVLGILL